MLSEAKVCTLFRSTPIGRICYCICREKMGEPAGKASSAGSAQRATTGMLLFGPHVPFEGVAGTRWHAIHHNLALMLQAYTDKK
jgi:hypothetical protein